MIHVTELEMREILTILTNYFTEGRVLAFGSRHKGTHKKFSDLDLAFIKHNGTALENAEWGSLKEKFEESNLVFRVDIVDYLATTENFRKIIDENCIEIYNSKNVNAH